MRFALSLTALTIAAMGTACSSGDTFQSLDMESPFTCGDFNNPGAGFNATAAFADQMGLIAKEFTDDREVQWYFRNVVYSNSPYTAKHRDAFYSNRTNLCAKHPSKGINEAIIEAAQQTYQEHGSDYGVQKCSTLDQHLAQVEALSAEMNSTREFNDRIDRTPLQISRLKSICSDNPNAVILLALEEAVRDTANEHNELVREMQSNEGEARQQEFANQLKQSLIVNNDIDCARMSQLQTAAGENWSSEDTQAFFRSEIMKVLTANYSENDLNTLKRFAGEIKRECELNRNSGIRSDADWYINEHGSTPSVDADGQPLDVEWRW